MKTQAVYDSLTNGQFTQAKEQIKRLSYDERIVLIKCMPDDIGHYCRDLILNTVVKRDFK